MGPDTTNYTYTGPLIIGFDSEWVYRPETQRNHVLSYQFAGRSADGAWSGIIYTEGPDQKDRLRLAESDKDVRDFVSAIESLWNIHH